MSTSRPLTLLLLSAVASGAGCAQTCPNPQYTLDGKVFEIFSSVQSARPSPIQGPFPAEWNPANGTHSWEIGWLSANFESAITWTVDGQEFEGTGTWDDEVCGNVFLRTKEGTYYADPEDADREEPLGARFKFLQSGSFETWVDETGRPRLEGDLHFEGYWYAETGESELVSFETQVVTARTAGG